MNISDGPLLILLVKDSNGKIKLFQSSLPDRIEYALSQFTSSLIALAFMDPYPLQSY